MQNPGENAVPRLHQNGGNGPRPASSQPSGSSLLGTIPYTELPEGPAGSPIATEWDFYRRTVGRLLAEGHEGRWLLIQKEDIVGLWDTEAEANAVRVARFAHQPVLMKQVLAREPILRIGFNRLCHS
jgi:hypothetical protein